MKPQFFSVDINKFRNTMRSITFDLYLKVSEEHYAHVFSKTTGLDYNRLEKYIQRGITELFIPTEDQTLYEKYAAETTSAIFKDPESPPEKKVAALLNMTEQNLATIFSNLTVDEETAEKTQQQIKGYAKLMVQDPQTLTAILKLVSYGDYLYYHSTAVSVFSLFLSKASGQYHYQTIEQIGLGGFLHDIGRTLIPFEINNSPTALTVEQWKIMKTHPKLGLNMLEKAKNISDEARYIVYQHHEQPSGNGYPNGIKNSNIFPPAKIVAIADAFSSLLSTRPFRKAFSPEKAIRLMKSETGKYDQQLIQLLASIFIQKRSTPTNQSA